MVGAKIVRRKTDDEIEALRAKQINLRSHIEQLEKEARSSRKELDQISGRLRVLLLPPGVG